MPLINPGPLEWDTTIQWDPTVPNATGWVDIPFDLAATFGKANLVPVVATFDGAVTYRGSIAKMPQPCLILRKDVRAALDGAAQADTFAGLAYSHQRAYVEWIEEARRAETRERRIARAVEMLREGKKGPR